MSRNKAGFLQGGELSAVVVIDGIKLCDIVCAVALVKILVFGICLYECVLNVGNFRLSALYTKPDVRVKLSVF